MGRCEKAHKVNGLAVGKYGGLGRAQGYGLSFIREEIFYFLLGGGGVVSPLGLLVRGHHAIETIPTKMIESPSTWISGTYEALQV